MSEINTDLLIKFLQRVPDTDADDILVGNILKEMRISLKEKRESGSTGWHTKDANNYELMESLIKHVKDANMIDVINLASMILTRQDIYGDTEHLSCIEEEFNPTPARGCTEDEL